MIGPGGVIVVTSFDLVIQLMWHQWWSYLVQRAFNGDSYGSKLKVLWHTNGVIQGGDHEGGFWRFFFVVCCVGIFFCLVSFFFYGMIGMWIICERAKWCLFSVFLVTYWHSFSFVSLGISLFHSKVRMQQTKKMSTLRLFQHWVAKCIIKREIFGVLEKTVSISMGGEQSKPQGTASQWFQRQPRCGRRSDRGVVFFVLCRVSMNSVELFFFQRENWMSYLVLSWWCQIERDLCLFCSIFFCVNPADVLFHRCVWNGAFTAIG